MLRKSLLLVCLGFLLADISVSAQNVFALPGPNSTAQNVLIYSSDPLQQAANVSAGAGSFLAFALPDGSKYYVVATAGNGTITAMDRNFVNPRTVANLGQAAVAAALTPDGRRLIVVASTVHIYNTATDLDVVSGGLAFSFTPTDVAVSLDSSRIFILGQTPQGSGILTAVDPNGAILGSLSIPGVATGVVVGPNGLVYVSSQNQILEINPTSLTATSSGAIGVNARPGKLVFTPDGHYALAVNQTPITGSSVLLIDLQAHIVAGSLPTSSAGVSIQLDKLYVLSNTSYWGYSSANGTVYSIVLNGTSLSIAPVLLPQIATGGLVATAITNEVASPTRNVPQFFFFISNSASGSTLYRVDLAQNQINVSSALTGSPSALAYVAPALTNAVPSTLLQYGQNQTLATGATSNPLVVRALDSQGRPISGAQVAFTSSNAGAVLTPASATTNADGFAMTTLTAPSTAGTMTVTATVAGLTANYTITVGNPGGGGTPTGGISIVQGQGQILYENANTSIAGSGFGGSPLTVLVQDGSGNPVPNAPVTFNVATGGQFLALTGSSSVITTDNNGMASANFLTSFFTSGLGFAQGTITASAPGTNTVTFYVTVVKRFANQNDGPPNISLKKPDIGATYTGPAGSVIPGAVVAQVLSAGGRPIPNVSLYLIQDSNSQTGATCNDPMGTGVLTDATGTVTCDLLLNGHVGTAKLTPNVGYLQNFDAHAFTLTITPGAPAKVVITQGNNQTVNAGQRVPLALIVQVSDAGGNVLPNAPVTFTVSPAAALTLSNVSSATNSSGLASATATAGNVAGIATVKVTSGTGSASFTITVNIPASGIQKVSGDNQTTVVNTAFAQPLVVKVTNAAGQGVAGLQVSFAVTQGSASVGTASATTDASGQASTTVTAGAGAGPITVTATSSTFSTTFSLSSRLAGPSGVVILNGAGLQQMWPNGGSQTGVAPGAIIAIQGKGIATNVQGIVLPGNIIGPLPTTLPATGGASVTFNGTPAPIYSISNQNGVEQIVVQVPYEIGGATSANMTISGAGGGSATISNIPVLPFAPGIFETNAFGLQHEAVALHAADGTYVTPSNPAKRGETFYIFATGLGQTTPAVQTNSAGIPGQNVAGSIVAGVNNGGVLLISAQTVPGLVGVYAVALQIPADTETGPNQPVGVIAFDVNGTPYFAQGAFIPIQ